MANLAITAVKFLDQYQTDGRSGSKFSARRVKATLTTMGGLTNKLVASAFNLRLITSVTNAVKSDNTIVAAAPSVAGDFVILASGDVSGDYYFTVKGYSI